MLFHAERDVGIYLILNSLPKEKLVSKTPSVVNSYFTQSYVCVYTSLGEHLQLHI